MPPFTYDVQITRGQAVKIIEYLAKEGFLAKAGDGNQNSSREEPGPGYALNVQFEVAKDRPYAFDEHLGWGVPMLKRLEGLRGVLNGDAAQAMDKLLAPLAELRPQGGGGTSDAKSAEVAGSREAVFSGLAYYRVGDEFLVGLGYSTPRPVEHVEFDKQRLDYLGPEGNHVKFRVKAPGFADFKVRFRGGSSEGTADILPPPEKDDEPRPANSKVTQWLGADAIRILARPKSSSATRSILRTISFRRAEMIGHGPQMKPRIGEYRIVHTAREAGQDAVQKVRDLLFDAGLCPVSRQPERLRTDHGHPRQTAGQGGHLAH